MGLLRLRLSLFVLATAILAAAAGAITMWWGTRTNANPIAIAQQVCWGLAPIIEDGDETAITRQVTKYQAATGCSVSIYDTRGDLIAGPGISRLPSVALKDVGDGVLLTSPSQPADTLVPVRASHGALVGYARFQDPPLALEAIFAPVNRAPLFTLFGVLGIITGIGYLALGPTVQSIDRIRTLVTGLRSGKSQVRVKRIPLRELRPTARDIGEIAARLRQVSTSSRFVNDIVQSMVDSLIVVDRQARIRAVNQATLDIVGYTESELIGRTASLICVADGLHLTGEQLDHLLGSGSKNDHEVIYITKDGKRIPISLSGSSIKDEKGETSGYVCIGTDITHRKDAEAEREELHRRVVATSRQAGMAEVATGVLHNVGNVLNSVNVSASIVEESLKSMKLPNLVQAAEMLKNKEKSDLVRFLTEDAAGTKVPEYIIKIADLLNEERDRMVNEIKSVTKHIDHIKDIVSVQQNISKTTGVIEPTDMHDVIEDALRMCAATIERDGLRVRKTLAQIPPVICDKHKVMQILVNLISNARDAIRDRGVENGTIGIKLAESKGNVELSVTDNGVGIEPAALTRIFTHGFTTKKDGHGFGLHSAANAAKEMQGALSANSEGTGKGSTFTLALPIQPQTSKGVAS